MSKCRQPSYLARNFRTSHVPQTVEEINAKIPSVAQSQAEVSSPTISQLMFYSTPLYSLTDVGATDHSIAYEKVKS